MDAIPGVGRSLSCNGGMTLARRGMSSLRAGICGELPAAEKFAGFGKDRQVLEYGEGQMIPEAEGRIHNGSLDKLLQFTGRWRTTISAINHLDSSRRGESRMRKIFRGMDILCNSNRVLCLSLAIVVLLAGRGYAEAHDFSVRDSIEMTRFDDPVDSEPDRKVLFSPDENYFAFVTSRGIIKSDKIESTLSLFRSRRVRSFLSGTRAAIAPAPRRLATVKAVPNGDARTNYASTISNMRWSSDSQSIYFLAEKSDGSRQLYQVCIHSGAIRRLTPRGYDIRQFDIKTGVVIYAGLKMYHKVDREETTYRLSINHDARSVTGVPIGNILFKEASTQSGVPGLWEIKDGHTRQVACQTSGLPQGDSIYWSGFLSLSPGAHWVVQLLPVKEVPVSWEAYKPASGISFYQIHAKDPRITSPYNLERLVHYALIDLRSGATIPIIRAPHARSVAYGDRDLAIWSPDERRLLLTNTFLPLESADPAERSRRVRPCAAASIEVALRQVTCVAFSRFDHRAIDQNGVSGLTLRSASFGATDDEVILTFGEGPVGTTIERYRFTGGIWKLVERAADDARISSTLDSSRKAGDTRTSLLIDVRQGLNEPPTLWATDSVTGASGRIWDPNPQCANTVLTQVSAYRWRAGSGREWSGGLIWPTGYVSGRRYPLVIQTHGFSDNEFMTDGGPPTAMAARALASSGFFVLQIPISYDLQLSSEEGSQTHLEFATAISRLAKEGLIDPHRIGITGFSWTCLHVENALIEDPHLFAAATIADGVDHSYMQYHLWGADNIGIAYQSEQVNRGKPLGEGLKGWLRNAPGFHLDRVQTPLRVEAISQLGLLGEWEIYSSLMQQQKAVDLVYFPYGQHVLQKPLERFASEQGNIDWFRFWLQGYEDRAPEKRRQYAVWRQLRLLQTGLAAN
jgi:hypothetical protein